MRSAASARGHGSADAEAAADSDGILFAVVESQPVPRRENQGPRRLDSSAGLVDATPRFGRGQHCPQLLPVVIRECRAVGVISARVGARELIRRTFEGARLPTWARECPEWVPVVLFAASSLIGVATGIASGWARFSWFFLAVMVFAIAALLSWARAEAGRSAQAKKDRWIARAEAEHRQSLRKLLQDDFYLLLYVVSEVLLEPRLAERRRAAAAARKTVICATAKLIGRATDGTRANLFVQGGGRNHGFGARDVLWAR